MIPRFDNLGRPADIFWHGQTKLIDEVEHAFAVDDQVAADGQTSRLDDQVFQVVYEFEDLHWRLPKSVKPS